MGPDADPDPAIFVIDLKDYKLQRKTNLKKSFRLLLYEDTFTSFFKDKKSKRSHKAIEIKVFHTILLGDRRIRSRIRIHTSD
jgi:hypothetical protein